MALLVLDPLHAAVVELYVLNMDADAMVVLDQSPTRTYPLSYLYSLHMNAIQERSFSSYATLPVIHQLSAKPLMNRVPA